MSPALDLRRISSAMKNLPVAGRIRHGKGPRFNYQARRARAEKMYIPKHFEGDEARGREIMQAHGWALLITADEAGAPVCTHLALVWEDDGSPHGTLVGHMARANDHWKLFAEARSSLALFW